MSPSITERCATALRWLRRAAHLAVGVPDYAAYCLHMREHHPDREPMSRTHFHRERMDARYARGRSRCC